MKQKNIFIPVILNILLFLVAPALGQPVYFNKTVVLGGVFGVGLSVLERDSGYLVGGVVGGGRINIGIVLLDSIGEKIALKTYGEAGTDCYAGRSGSLKEVNGKYILGGGKDYYDSTASYFLKFNAVGDTIFSREYNSQISDFIYFNNSYPTCDGGYVFTGECYISGYNTDLVLLKTDSSGNETWRKLYGWNSADNGFSIIQSPDSGYVVGGYSYQPGVDDSGDPLIVKFDKDGNYQWYRKPGGPLDDDLAMVCISSDSNIVAFTTYNDSTYGAGECGRVNIIKYDQQGTIIWNKKYGSSWHGRHAGNIKLLSDLGFICCGSIIDTTHTQYFGWIMKFDKEGDSIWYREYAYRNYPYELSYLYDITPTSDGGFIACGQTKAEPPNSLQKIWVLKVDSIGCDTAGCDPTVGITERGEAGEPGSGEAGKQGGLEIWPNPARDEIHVRFYMDDGRFYKDLGLEIWDIFGRKACEVLHSSPRVGGGREGGWQDWTVDVSALLPGIYLAVLREKQITQRSAKFIVTR